MVIIGITFHLCIDSCNWITFWLTTATSSGSARNATRCHLRQMAAMRARIWGREKIDKLIILSLNEAKKCWSSIWEGWIYRSIDKSIGLSLVGHRKVYRNTLISQQISVCRFFSDFLFCIREVESAREKERARHFPKWKMIFLPRTWARQWWRCSSGVGQCLQFR